MGERKFNRKRRNSVKRTNLFFLGLLLLVAVLVACGPAGVPEGATTEAPEGDVAPRPTVTSGPAPESETEAEEGYPAPRAATATPEGYPAPPTAAPREAYPSADGTVWVIQPVGVQCEGDKYETLQEAVTELEEASVTVSASQSTSLMVCQACGCPTSEHFRVQIAAEDLDTAADLGWTAEE
jgi:hypothetical protein